MRKRRLLGIDISHITIIQSNVPGILDDISGLCSGRQEYQGRQERKMANEAQRRREQHMLSLPTSRIAEAPSVGEILLPFLFAAMETCWIDAIFIGLAGIDFFASRDPLMPLWTPVVIIIGPQWILSRLGLRAAVSTTEATAEGDTENGKKNPPRSSIFFTRFFGVTLFISRFRIYA